MDRAGVVKAAMQHPGRRTNLIWPDNRHEAAAPSPAATSQ